MKKITLAILQIAGFALASQAQKGSILVYGVMGISTEKDPNGDKTTTYSIDPGIGYQFSKHWTAGVAGGYDKDKFSPAAAVGTESSDYKAGGFARYTHLFNAIFSLYGQGDVYYHGTKVQDVQSNGLGISLVPTIGINVFNNFALNISFGGITYETIKVKDAANATKTFDLDFGHQVRIGISKNFGGEK
jgi:hypothetical protein